MIFNTNNEGEKVQGAKDGYKNEESLYQDGRREERERERHLGGNNNMVDHLPRHIRRTVPPKSCGVRAPMASYLRRVII
jgi:hypothetical protein